MFVIWCPAGPTCVWRSEEEEQWWYLVLSAAAFFWIPPLKVNIWALNMDHFSAITHLRSHLFLIVVVYDLWWPFINTKIHLHNREFALAALCRQCLSVRHIKVLNMRPDVVYMWQIWCEDEIPRVSDCLYSAILGIQTGWRNFKISDVRFCHIWDPSQFFLWRQPLF